MNWFSIFRLLFRRRRPAATSSKDRLSYSDQPEPDVPVDTVLATQQPSRLSWWKQLGAWWRRRRNRPAEASIPPADPPTAAREEKGDLFDRVFKENVPLQLDSGALLAPGLENYIRVRGKDFWLTGVNDGIKGIDNNAIEDIAGVHANTLVEYVRACSRGKLQAFKSESAVKKSIVEDEEEAYCDAKAHLDEMKYFYHKHPRTFSWILFLFYFSIAIFLIIADIPLASILTEKGFNLIPGSGASRLLTIGLALCAVYIKIYYDDYVATHIGHYAGQFKKIIGIIGDKKRKPTALESDDSQENNSDNASSGDTGRAEQARAEQEKRDLQQSVLEYWLKWGVKTSILLLTMYTIWVLGKFRYQNIDDSERTLLMEFAKWAHHNMGYDLQGSLRESFDVTLRAFRLITVIFPLIGGICLSLAMTNLQNLRRFARAKRSYRQQQQHYLLALGEYSRSKKQYEDFKGIYNEWQSSDKGYDHIQYYTKVFKSYYLLGYQNGFVTPDYFNPLDDVYEQTEKLRRRMTDRRIYTQLHGERS